MVRARLKDVAAASGVSTATVSMVLNETNDRISQATINRVRKVAAELGYTPNSAARSLRTRKTHTLGVVTDNVLTTPFAYAMLQGAQDVAWDNDYLLLILGTEGDEAQQAKGAQLLAARQVDGLLLGAMYHRELDFSADTFGLATVGMNASPRHGDAPCFVPDDFEGARQATELLTSRGHRRIVHITERHTDGLARDLRTAGFDRAMSEAGITSAVVVEPRPEDDSGSIGSENIALELLDSPDRPSAIFTFNDLMAVGVYRAAHRLGLSIPGDLSVVGFDDQQFVAAELAPGLTTMALPHYEMGQLATQALLAQLGQLTEGAPTTIGTTRVPCPAVVRNSIADVSGAAR